jgi:putative sterol carrier protein
VGELAVALRLVAGKIVSSHEIPPDTLVQIALSEEDFGPILVRGAEELERTKTATDRQLAVFKALLVDAERAESIRAVAGSLAVELAGERTHRLTLTPGTRPPRDAAECTVRCALSDFWAMQRGEANPFELMMNGKIQITGDAQIVMVLSSLFV